ncbi:MAG: hypothetical protein PGN34_09335 [Methylobacterium frigidaeris]
MTQPLPRPLIHDLIEIAESLANQQGRPLLRQTALRRAVSSAYYAVFHAVCAVCADELVGRSKVALSEPIYRSIDHGLARKRLNGPAVRPIDPSLPRVGVIFAELQEQRHAADYSPPQPLFSRTRALALIDQAREAVRLIEALETGQRQQLAILLIGRQRAA